VKPTNPSRQRRADRLASLHGELKTLIRRATAVRDPDLFNRGGPKIETREVFFTERHVTMSLRQACDLFRAAMPPTAHDASTRRTHAMLIITLRHLLDTLRTINDNEIPPAAIAAAELVGKQVRIWLRQAQKPKAKRARTPAPATAQTTLLLPLNIRSLLRQESTPSHNLSPVRSHDAPEALSEDTDLIKTRTTSNEKPRPRRTA